MNFTFIIQKVNLIIKQIAKYTFKKEEEGVLSLLYLELLPKFQIIT